MIRERIRLGVLLFPTIVPYLVDWMNVFRDPVIVEVLVGYHRLLVVDGVH